MQERRTKRWAVDDDTGEVFPYVYPDEEGEYICAFCITFPRKIQAYRYAKNNFGKDFIRCSSCQKKYFGQGICPHCGYDSFVEDFR